MFLAAHLLPAGRLLPCSDVRRSRSSVHRDQKMKSSFALANIGVALGPDAPTDWPRMDF